jgi:hypothetical protein
MVVCGRPSGGLKGRRMKRRAVAEARNVAAST